MECSVLMAGAVACCLEAHGQAACKQLICSSSYSVFSWALRCIVVECRLLLLRCHACLAEGGMASLLPGRLPQYLPAS